ncbi:hypothetical protein BV20DRAFT_145052 [Pilatotrama ljubarskyi]|nr:hypothetical protein BV20DRAFT_145052 [Pilatotrama ljubarskyi]
MRPPQSYPGSRPPRTGHEALAKPPLPISPHRCLILSQPCLLFSLVCVSLVDLGFGSLLDDSTLHILYLGVAASSEPRASPVLRWTLAAYSGRRLGQLHVRTYSSYAHRRRAHHSYERRPVSRPSRLAMSGSSERAATHGIQPQARRTWCEAEAGLRIRAMRLPRTLAPSHALRLPIRTSLWLPRVGPRTSWARAPELGQSLRAVLHARPLAQSRGACSYRATAGTRMLGLSEYPFVGCFGTFGVLTDDQLRGNR